MRRTFERRIKHLFSIALALTLAALAMGAVTDAAGTLILTSFDDCRVPGPYASYWGPFTDGRHSQADVDCLSSGDPARGEILRLKYDVVYHDAFAGLVIQWNVDGFSLEEWEALTFYVRGDGSATARARVELKIEGEAWGWRFHDVEGITNEWQQVVVPLAAFTDSGGWFRQSEVTITLLHDGVTEPQGALLVDEFAFVRAEETCRVRYAPASPIAGAPVAFTVLCDEEARGSAAAFAWEFGDGTRGEGQETIHAFADGGTYAVTVVALDGAGHEIARCTEDVTAQSLPRSRWGVVVGIDDYLYADARTCPGFCDLSFCEADAEGVTAALAGHTSCYDQGELAVLLSEGATRAAIYEAFQTTIREARPGDLVVFYFSGHGARTWDDEGNEPDGVDEFLLPVDYVPGKVYGTGIRDDQLMGDFIAPLRDRYVLLILDSCYSGGGARDAKGAAELEYRGPPSSTLTAYEEPIPSGTLLIAASRENKPAFEDASLGHGVFTYCLLEAITATGSRGCLPADEDGDGIVTVGELFGYIEERVPALTGYSQTPVLVGDVTLLQLPFARGAPRDDAP